MKMDIEKLYAREAEILKAMAHPTRLCILNAIKKKEVCVCKLTEMVGDDISTVSKHLLVLKNAGLVASRREGNWLFYSLKCPCVLDFSACIAGLKR
jgi:ArsR family transcriptional regulator